MRDTMYNFMCTTAEEAYPNADVKWSLKDSDSDIIADDVDEFMGTPDVCTIDSFAPTYSVDAAANQNYGTVECLAYNVVGEGVAASITLKIIGMDCIRIKLGM